MNDVLELDDMPEGFDPKKLPPDVVAQLSRKICKAWGLEYAPRAKREPSVRKGPRVTDGDWGGLVRWLRATGMGTKQIQAAVKQNMSSNV